MQLANTPIEAITVNGHSFYLKRDDLLHPDFSGNKARKFYSLLQQDLSAVDKLISYGSPQANSLHSLAVLAKMKGVGLDYYVDHIAAFMRQNPAGNYRAALEHGANVIVADKPTEQSMAEFIAEAVLPNQTRCLYIPEGGHYQAAEVGIKLLADEIIVWAKSQNLCELQVALPSGTGTTALFLQKHFCEQGLAFEVLTCACVGGDDYLRQQFSELCLNSGPKSSVKSRVKSHVTFYPRILPASKKFHFGKLYQQSFEIWLQLKAQTGVEFELLYDPLGWLTLLDYVNRPEQSSSNKPILYIHQGGLLGNETMLARYQRKFPAL